MTASSSVTTFAMNENTNILGGETKEMGSKVQEFSNSPLYREFLFYMTGDDI